MKVNAKEYSCFDYETDSQEFRGFKVGEVVFDGKIINGCKSIGVVLSIECKGAWAFCLSSFGEQCNISKCPDDVALKAIPLLKQHKLAFATPDGKVVGLDAAKALGDDNLIHDM